MGQIDMKGDKARFPKYPDSGAFRTKKSTVAGIKGRMVGDSESGPWQEDEIACGCGQSIERMGSVKGAADSAAKDKSITRMKKMR